MPNKLANLKPVFFIIFVITVFFLPFLPGRLLVTTGVTKSDQINQNYAYKYVYQQALAGQRSFFWLPEVANGLPWLAEGQTGQFYPFNLIIFEPLNFINSRLYNLAFAYNLFLFLHVLLMALSTYLFTRKILKFCPVSAVISSLAFSLSGFTIIHLVHPNMLAVFSWLPLQFYFIERMFSGKKLIWDFFWLTLIFCLQFLAGHPSILFQISLVLGLYLLLRIFFFAKLTFKSSLPLIIFIMAALFGAGIAAVQLLPSWEFTRQSTRATGLSIQEATSFTFPIKHLLTFVFPWGFDVITTTTETFGTIDSANLWENYGYVGLLVLGLVFVNFIYPKKSKYTIIYSLIVFACLLLAFGRSTPFFGWFWSVVPGFNLFRYPTRFLVFVAFGLSILAGFGWQIIKEKFFTTPGVSRLKAIDSPGVKLFSLIPLILLTLISIDLIFTQSRIHQTTPTGWWFKDLQSVEFLKRNLNNHRFWTVGTTNLKYADARDLEVQRQAQELLPANFNLYYGLLTNNFQSGILPETLTALNLAVNKKVQFDQKNNSLTMGPEFLKILSLQSVKYLVSDLPLSDSDLNLETTITLNPLLTHIIPMVSGNQVEVKEIPTDKIYIYENSQVLPRVFLTGQMVFAGENWDDIDLSTADFGQNAYLNQQTEWQNNPEFKGGAKISSYQDAQVQIQTESESESILVLTDSWYPGWQAEVDGQKTPIYRADYSFRAVKLPPGQHQVIFRYQPNSFNLGLKISLGSLIIFVIFLITISVTGSKKVLSKKL